MDYDDRKKQIANTLEKIDDIYKDICHTDYADADCKLNKEVTDIVTIVTEFLKMSGLLLKYQIEIPESVILTQLHNLLDAFENKDYVMLADTLHYEISETLLFYKEILDELKKENIYLQTCDIIDII